MKNKTYIFFMFFISSFIFCYSLAYALNLDQGLVAHYPFDGDANDATANNYHGTVSGDIEFVKNSSHFGAYFDGIDDVIIVYNVDNLFPGTSDFTISYWVLLGEYSQVTLSEKLFLLYGDEKYIWIQTERNENYINFSSKSNDYGTLVPGQIEENKWLHVVGKRVGTTISIYINGKKVDTRESPFLYDLSNTNAQLVFGSPGFYPNSTCSGSRKIGQKRVEITLHPPCPVW